MPYRRTTLILTHGGSRCPLRLATVERAPRRIVRQDRYVLGHATVASAIRAKTDAGARTAAFAVAVDMQNLAQPAATSEITNTKEILYSENFGQRLLDHGDPADAVFLRLPAQRPRAICDPVMRTHDSFTTDQLDVRERPPQMLSTRSEELFKLEISSLSALVDEDVGVGLCDKEHLP